MLSSRGRDDDVRCAESNSQCLQTLPRFNFADNDRLPALKSGLELQVSVDALLHDHAGLLLFSVDG